MLQLLNTSPFKAAFSRIPDAQGRDCLFLVVKATFQLWPRLELSEQQVKPALSDDYHGAPGASSLRYPGELHLGKPTTDLILVGHAIPPEEKPVTQLNVRLRLAELEKVVRVFGDRQWERSEPSLPAPFVRIPLVYERAFGGLLEVDDAPPLMEERNPLGVGLAVSHGRAERGDKLPNLEDPKQLLADGVVPAPAAFAAIPAAWLSRRILAGTYDEAWQKKRCPYLPNDFQPRYFNCAAEGLVFDRHLQGGEPLTLEGVGARGPLETVLPRCTLETAFVLHGQRHVRPNRLQTVLVEPDENRLCLTFHSDFPCDKVPLDVETIEVALTGLQLTAAA
jgi:hypothetical protein